MSRNLKVQEYREDEVGGEAVATIAGAPIDDSMITGNPITQNGSLTGKVMHATTIYYRNLNTKANNVLRIYDGAPIPANLRREYFIPIGQSNEIIDVRGLRFDNTTTGIFCVALFDSIFVHVGGVLRDS